MKIRKLYRCTLGVLLLTTLTTLASCSRKADYTVALIETSINEYKTNFTFLNSLFQQTEQTTYPYGSVGSYGYSTPCVRNGKMYEMSIGDCYKQDFGTVLGYDLASGTMTEYQFNRVNLTDFLVTDDYIYTLSNLNQITYIDRYCLQTNVIDTYELKNQISMDFCLIGDDLYVLAEESSKYTLYRIDIPSQTCEKKYDMSKWYLEKGGPNYLVAYKDELYMPAQNCLLNYSPASNSVQEIVLPCNNAWGLTLEKDKLYISCVDIFDPKAGSNIVVYDLSKQQITATHPVETSIMQFSVKDDSLYVLGNADLSLYHLDGDQCTLVTKTEVMPSSREQRISGMFVFKLHD